MARTRSVPSAELPPSRCLLPADSVRRHLHPRSRGPRPGPSGLGTARLHFPSEPFLSLLRPPSSSRQSFPRSAFPPTAVVSPPPCPLYSSERDMSSRLHVRGDIESRNVNDAISTSCVSPLPLPRAAQTNKLSPFSHTPPVRSAPCSPPPSSRQWCSPSACCPGTGDGSCSAFRELLPTSKPNTYRPTSTSPSRRRCPTPPRPSQPPGP